jgi:hypothetical protein
MKIANCRDEEVQDTHRIITRKSKNEKIYLYCKLNTHNIHKSPGIIAEIHNLCDDCDNG